MFGTFLLACVSITCVVTALCVCVCVCVCVVVVIEFTLSVSSQAAPVVLTRWTERRASTVLPKVQDQEQQGGRDTCENRDGSLWRYIMDQLNTNHKQL